ncbi:hypothetical protein HY988_02300 [Candidatus Micrarchaeota archaeon]|nr:hypothetical protein [Candidatus Micrarchaeota archaeon]
MSYRAAIASIGVTSLFFGVASLPIAYLVRNHVVEAAQTKKTAFERKRLLEDDLVSNNLRRCVGDEGPRKDGRNCFAEAAAQRTKNEVNLAPLEIEAQAAVNQTTLSSPFSWFFKQFLYAAGVGGVLVGAILTIISIFAQKKNSASSGQEN